MFLPLLSCFVHCTAARALSNRDEQGYAYPLAAWSSTLTSISWFLSVKMGDVGGGDLSMLVDTGSSDTWALTSTACQGIDVGSTLYSPTGPKSDLRFDRLYGDGSRVTGNIYTENVCIDDQCAPIAFGAAGDCSQAQQVGSGILGLGSVQSTAGLPPFSRAFSESKSIPAITSFQMNGVGEIIAVRFGEPDTSAWKGNLQKITNTYGKFQQTWSGTATAFADQNPLEGILDLAFDTGTDAIVLPEQVVNAYFQIADGGLPPGATRRFGSVPCGTDPPALTFKFADPAGEKTYTVSSKALLRNGQYVVGSNAARAASPDPDDCRKWVPIEIDETFSILGAPFWFEHIVVLNSDDNSIGWADVVEE